MQAFCTATMKKLKYVVGVIYHYYSIPWGGEESNNDKKGQLGQLKKA